MQRLNLKFFETFMTMILKSQSEMHKLFISSNSSHAEVMRKLKDIGVCKWTIIYIGSLGSIYLKQNTTRINKVLKLDMTWEKQRIRKNKPKNNWKFIFLNIEIESMALITW